LRKYLVWESLLIHLENQERKRERERERGDRKRGRRPEGEKE
jgi:hypothetical protein